MKSISPFTPSRGITSVKRLTQGICSVVFASFLIGCSMPHNPGDDSYLQRRYSDSCKSHAYVRTILADHISNRYSSDAMVRLAILPFAAPANVTGIGPEQPGMGSELAWQIQARFLEGDQVSIAEVFNRRDWPGKADEFFSGNFGSLELAREAGYDLLLVGLIESPREMDALTAYSKIIEIESGTTLWYGKSTARTARRSNSRLMNSLGLEKRIPSAMHYDVLMDQLARCVVRDSTSEHVS